MIFSISRRKAKTALVNFTELRALFTGTLAKEAAKFKEANFAIFFNIIFATNITLHHNGLVQCERQF